MSEGVEKDDLDALQEDAKLVSEHAFRIIRLNLLLVGLYLTVGTYIGNLGSAIREGILSSYYTMAAGALLLMSLLVGYLTYESTVRIAAINLYNNPESKLARYSSYSRLAFNIRYAVLLSLLSGVSFAFGIFDGFVAGGINVIWVWHLVFAVLVISVIPVLLINISSKARRYLNELLHWP